MYMLHWAVYVGTWQLGVGSAKSEVVAVLIWRRPAIDALLFLLANDKFVQPIPRKTFFRNHETIVTAIAGSLNVMEWPLALLFPIRGGFGIYMHPKSWHCQKGGDSAPCQDFFWRICPQCTKGPPKWSLTTKKWYFPPKSVPLFPRIDHLTTFL